MIKFHTWLSQIGRTCELLADQNIMHHVWVDGDRTITSIVNFDELYEQIFDDLDSESFEPKLSYFRGMDAETDKSIRKFLNALRAIDVESTNSEALKNPDRLLKSEIWKQLVRACEDVLKSAKVSEAMSKPIK